MSERTPGPWHVATNGHVRNYADYLVAVTNHDADARLIASAPALLEAAQQLDAVAIEMQRTYRHLLEDAGGIMGAPIVRGLRKQLEFAQIARDSARAAIDAALGKL